MVLDYYKREALKEIKFSNSMVPMKVYEVYSIAKRYYGEDRVELSVGYDSYNERMYVGKVNVHIPSWPTEEHIENPTIDEIADWFASVYAILIYFPEVTVSNEANQSTVIKDLFIRVPLNNNGTIAAPFRLVRSTYTNEELAAGYMHSHCHQLNRTHPENWDIPCLGTGPLRTTMSLLMSDEFDEQRYTLFFWELDKFTQVESLSGIPYIKLQSIGISNDSRAKVRAVNVRTATLLYSERDAFTAFIKSYMKTDLFKMTIANGKVVLGMPFIEWLVSLTKYYKKWKIMTSSLEIGNLDNKMSNYFIRDNVLYQNLHRENWERHVGTSIVKFKDRDFKFNIVQSTTEVEGIQLFNVGFALFVLNHILTYINCCYNGKNTKYSPERTSDTDLKGSLIRASE